MNRLVCFNTSAGGVLRNRNGSSRAESWQLCICPDVQFGSALALALTGEVERAQALADDLTKRYPVDTIVRFLCPPVIRPRLAVARKGSPEGH
jgi:hypothetical protein